jgi:phosphatidylglycerol:prolipoprotein diacylglycerol transferase
MCSELFRIPIDWHGVPLFGFGVILLAWLGIGAWAMRSTARQADWATAAKVHLPTILIVAALIALVIPKFVPGGVPIRSYGLLVLIGLVLGIGLSMRRGLMGGLSLDDMMALAIWMIPGGAIGGRLFYVIEYWDERIRQPTVWGTLKNALAFTEGGLVVYGAFLGCMAAFLAFVAYRKLPALAIADLVAPAVLMGQAFGRVGCLMNGCCYGGEADVPWAITFPRENSPTTPSPPYAEQAGLGRLFGFRVDQKPGDPRAIVVEQVDAGSAAAKAGLEPGDVITSITLQLDAAAREIYYGPVGGDLTGVDAAHPLVVTLTEPGSRELRELRLDTPLRAAHWLIFTALNEGLEMRVETSAGLRVLGPAPPPARSLPVHPTQIYSAIDAALLWWVLWSYYPFRRRDGEVMALLLILHPISRFLLEAIRVDESPIWGTGLSISQNLSLGFFLIGIAMWLILQRREPGHLALPLHSPGHGEPQAGGAR